MREILNKRPYERPGFPSNRIYLDNPDANMYGCLPCPLCGSRFRYPKGEPKMILCDDCRSMEQAEGCVPT